MDYIEQVNNSSSVESLLNIWASKPPMSVRDEHGETVCINHRRNIFIDDGIVNEEIWNREAKRILFLLKEAYGDANRWSLTNTLSEQGPWGNVWTRVAEWTCGLLNTNIQDGPAPYEKVYSDEQNSFFKNMLNKIAVVNVKKSDGRSSSNNAEILAYARADKEEIKKQISLISPTIIVCGNTFNALNDVYDKRIRKEDTWSADWWYHTRDITGNDTIIIDYYHPANHWSSQVNYYAVTSIYYQALKKLNITRGIV